MLNLNHCYYCTLCKHVLKHKKKKRQKFRLHSRELTHRINLIRMNFSKELQLYIPKFYQQPSILCLYFRFSSSSCFLDTALSTIFLLLLRHALKFLARYSSSYLLGTQETSVFVFSASSRLKSLLHWWCPCGFWRKIALFVIKTVLTLAATRTRAADAG